MATELLYMQDFGVEACSAKILSVTPTDDNRTDIALDQTCFYARGGGQDWDMGTIKNANGSFAVEEVRLDEDGVVHHVGTVTAGQLKEGDAVDCEVDHVRRGINMRLHSAAHVIDMAVADLGLDWVGTKGQHYPHLSAVEYSGTWDPAQAEALRAKLEQRTNEFIQQGSVNSIRFMPVSEMHTVCRHVPDNIPTNKPGRVVMYGEKFGVPCGGTHVKDIHEVGKVTIPKIKEKKGVIRVSYAVEGIGTE
ncbi:MAG TPA: alanine--tRNA ligase-related protein [Candidatus Saccharimonadales bacterium]